MYLREADITAAVDAWLLSLFDPENLDGAVAALTAAQEPDGAIAARAEAAKRKVADCDSRLAWYRKALEKGEAEIRALVGSQRKVLQALAGATAEQRAAIYSHMMGLRITYHAERNSISIESRRACAGCVSGDAESGVQNTKISEKNLVATKKCA